MTTARELRAQNVRVATLREAAAWIEAFDFDAADRQEPFDRPTVRNLARGLRAMADHAEAREAHRCIHPPDMVRCFTCGALGPMADPWAPDAPWPPQGDESPPRHPTSCRCDLCRSDAASEHESQR